MYTYLGKFNNADMVQDLSKLVLETKMMVRIVRPGRFEAVEDASECSKPSKSSDAGEGGEFGQLMRLKCRYLTIN